MAEAVALWAQRLLQAAMATVPALVSALVSVQAVRMPAVAA
jgi:hypothetical protein